MDSAFQEWTRTKNYDLKLSDINQHKPKTPHPQNYSNPSIATAQPASKKRPMCVGQWLRILRPGEFF